MNKIPNTDAAEDISFSYRLLGLTQEVTGHPAVRTVLSEFKSSGTRVHTRVQCLEMLWLTASSWNNLANFSFNYISESLHRLSDVIRVTFFCIQTVNWPKDGTFCILCSWSFSHQSQAAGSCSALCVDGCSQNAAVEGVWVLPSLQGSRVAAIMRSRADCPCAVLFPPACKGAVLRADLTYTLMQSAHWF